MDQIIVLAIAAGAWVAAGSLFLAWRGRAGDKQTVTTRIVRWAVRAGQVLLLAAPFFLQPSFTDWLVVGAMLVLCIVLSVWAEGARRKAGTWQSGD